MKQILILLIFIFTSISIKADDFDNNFLIGFNAGYEVVTGEQDVARWENGIGLGAKLQYQLNNTLDIGINIGYKSWNPVIRDAPIVFYYEAFPLTLDLRYYFDTNADYIPFLQAEGGIARFKTIQDLLDGTTNRRNRYFRTRSYQTVPNYSVGAGMRTHFLSDIDLDIVVKYNSLGLEGSDFNYVTIEIVALYKI